MNEFLRNFIMTGIRDMIKRDVALYQTYQYASGWFEKSILMQEDLEEISKLYEDKTKVVDNTEETNIETTEVEESEE